MDLFDKALKRIQVVRLDKAKIYVVELLRLGIDLAGDELMKKDLDARKGPPSSDNIDSERLLSDVRPLVERSRHSFAQAVNSELVLLYWHIGKRIGDEMPEESRAEYGARVVDMVSDRLTAEYGRGFRRSNIFNMVRFAEVFDFKTVQTLSGQLSWSHFIEIIYLKDPLQRPFYAEMARVERWSVRILRKKIQGMLYEPTAISRKPEELARHELEALQEAKLHEAIRLARGQMVARERM